MPPIIFAVNGTWCWYQLHPFFAGWWCGSDVEASVPAQRIQTLPCCPLPDQLPLDWFDMTGILPVSALDWQPEQYFPSARSGGQIHGLKVQKRPWIRQNVKSKGGTTIPCELLNKMVAYTLSNLDS